MFKHYLAELLQSRDAKVSEHRGDLLVGSQGNIHVHFRHVHCAVTAVKCFSIVFVKFIPINIMEAIIPEGMSLMQIALGWSIANFFFDNVWLSLRNRAVVSATTYVNA